MRAFGDRDDGCVAGGLNADFPDACYDDEDGPFAIRRLLQKSDNVHIGAAVYRRGFPIEVGTVSGLRARFQHDGTYLLVLGPHVVGLRCEGRPSSYQIRTNSEC